MYWLAIIILGITCVYQYVLIKNLTTEVKARGKILSALVWAVAKEKKLLSMEDLRKSIRIATGKQLPDEDDSHYDKRDNTYSDDYIEIFGDEMKGVRTALVLELRKELRTEEKN